LSLFTEKAIKYVPRLQKDLELTHVQACGLFGNSGTETGGFKHLQELKPVVAGSRGGYGWMQWTGPRRRAYEAWCRTNNLNPADDETNYRYLVHECKTDEARSITQLRKTTTVEAAAETFMLLNLRPGVPHLDSAREAYHATKPTSNTTKIVVAAATACTTATVATATAPVSFWSTWTGQGLMIGTAIIIIGGIVWYIRRQYKEYKSQKDKS
jgi:hypothetical protein